MQQNVGIVGTDGEISSSGPRPSIWGGAVKFFFNL